MNVKNDYAFLFDLDGTLINSDCIYIEVWNEILKKYNIECNKEFFESFIKGKSDISFLKFLIQNISENELLEISKLKDKLFIEKIENQNILFDGVLPFFEKIKNYKKAIGNGNGIGNGIGIVTSCNKQSANFILNKYNLTQYIDILICSEDVNNHKPHPEPYLKAMQLMNVNPSNCIIFEDSHTGYLSACKSNPYKIYIYLNGDNENMIIETKNVFYDYNELDINTLILKNNEPIIDMDESNIHFLKILKSDLKELPIKDIKINKNNNLKTGYICDIDKYNITYLNESNFNIITKISNLNNELSKTALKLNMYTNEVYFYQKISSTIECISIPKCFNCFKYEKKDVIVLEDLYKYNGCFNIDLNKNIKVLLNVVEHIFNMHNLYYFNNIHDIPLNFKNLKKPTEIIYYKELVNERFHKFMMKNKFILNEKDIKILNSIYENFDFILNKASEFPLSFCHGDLKSPNIFYYNHIQPYFLDWQYIQLNKGISDIAFLLVESIDFEIMNVELVLGYYFKLMKERNEINKDIFMNDFKNALCIFPFFVCVWFNSEDNDKLIDKCFPLKFMKNLLKYYQYYLVDFL